ncbi:penicillin-binding protein 2 [Steroidobacter sp. S1-65]|uniref:Peptidoglycan D,D-transpeptidase MrdA n=1 Tax=Steroidobacter gossypii TaxID=2805490 RepID=A0ABS1X5K8_9GAMM|nr:penicillin-binding protein 2 [Steroidobacter gossypii]MBM0108490.1 penicillin-binding protein 2 [Steroidobacter gossypii]
MPRSVRIKDHHAETQLFEQRAAIAAVIMVIAMGLVISRLVWLQVVKYEYFADLSQGNRIRIEPIPPNRGLILDRNGLPLATNAPSYQLELTKEQVEDIDATLQGIAAIGLIDPESIPNIKRDLRGRRSFDAVPIKLQLTELELARFAARRHQFPGVEIRPRLTRYYPLAESAVHAIGYVGAISEEDKKRLDLDDYAGTTLTGKNGVEYAYENQLHGKAGFQQLLVNAQGRSVERIGDEAAKLERREPIAGNDLFLTIDQRVQQAAEEALRGQRASAVAIDPANGDIIAFVSTPAFDPNLFARGLSRPEYLALTEDPRRPMYDRVIRGVYPPGSTVKPMMALAALEYGIVTPENSIFCRGAYRMPGVSRPWRDWKPGGHGHVDMRKSIATSCDVYFYDIANQMGVDRIHDYLEQFGMGQTTGIDIPGEKNGLLPSTDWKKKAFRRKEHQIWFPGDTISIGIGQGYMTATPLQLAHATATIANRGQRFKPRLVRAIRNVTTGEISELKPSPLPPAHVNDPSAWDVAIGGMYDVANAPYGTARGATANAPYKIAGKSGTAQVFTVAANEKMKKAGDLAEHLRDHALFIAFAPLDAPRIAVAVVVENAPGGGSAFAAPIARRILDVYLLTPEQLAEQEAKKKPALPVPVPRPGDTE